MALSAEHVSPVLSPKSFGNTDILLHEQDRHLSPRVVYLRDLPPNSNLARARYVYRTTFFHSRKSYYIHSLVVPLPDCFV